MPVQWFLPSIYMFALYVSPYILRYWLISVAFLSLLASGLFWGSSVGRYLHEPIGSLVLVTQGHHTSLVDARPCSSLFCGGWASFSNFPARRSCVGPSTHSRFSLVSSLLLLEFPLFSGKVNDAGESIIDKRSCYAFINADSETRKMYTLNTLIAHLIYIHKDQVISAAFTGISSTLLLNGRRFHSQFKATLRPESQRGFNIRKNSKLAENKKRRRF